MYMYSKTFSIFLILGTYFQLSKCICEKSFEKVDSTFGFAQRCSSISAEGSREIETILNERGNRPIIVIIISIVDSNIPVIYQTSFGNYFSVINLYLNNNNITAIESKAFSGMPRLSEIQLINNRLTHINGDIFHDHHILKRLDISYNYLTTLEHMRNFYWLQELNATNNKIILKGNIFQNMTNLKNLNLSRNKLTTMNYINQLHDLEVLNMSTNWLKTVTKDDFQNLTGLKLLDLSDNLLIHLPPKIFQNMTNLTELYLENNILESFSNNTFNKSIEYLNLTNNNLQNIQCEQIQGIVILRENYLVDICNFGANTSRIDLSANRFSRIKNGSFENLRTLSYLKLSENTIVTIESGAFKNLFKLDTLLLDKNAITILEFGIFVDLNNVKNLDLSSNGIKYIPIGAFTGLNSLTSLNLADNSIEYINTAIFYQTFKLSSLYLHKNPIITIDTVEINHILHHLTYLSFHIDKIGCSSLQYKLNILQNNDVVVKQGPEVTGPNVHGIACDQEEDEIDLEDRISFNEFIEFILRIQMLFYLTIGMFVILFSSYLLSWFYKQSKSNAKSVKDDGPSCSLTLLSRNDPE